MSAKISIHQSVEKTVNKPINLCNNMTATIELNFNALLTNMAGTNSC